MHIAGGEVFLLRDAFKKKKSQAERIIVFRSYAMGLLFVLAAFLVTEALFPILQSTLTLLFMVAVVLTTSYSGLKPGLLATVFALIGCAYVLPPNNSLAVDYPGHVALFFFACTSFLVCIVSEMLHTARRRAETSREQTEEATRSLKLLAQVSKALVGSNTPEAALRRAAHLTVPDFSDWCLIDIQEADGSFHNVVTAHNDPERADLAQRIGREHRLGLSVLARSEQAILSRQPEMGLTIPESRLLALTSDYEQQQRLREFEFSCYLCIPLLAPDRALGVVTFFWAESGRHYGPMELDWAWDFVSRCSLLVHNTQLLKGNRESEIKAQ